MTRAELALRAILAQQKKTLNVISIPRQVDIGSIENDFELAKDGALLELLIGIPVRSREVQKYSFIIKQIGCGNKQNATAHSKLQKI